MLDVGKMYGLSMTPSLLTMLLLILIWLLGSLRSNEKAVFISLEILVLDFLIFIEGNIEYSILDSLLMV